MILFLWSHLMKSNWLEIWFLFPGKWARSNNWLLFWNKLESHLFWPDSWGCGRGSYFFWLRRSLGPSFLPQTGSHLAPSNPKPHCLLFFFFFPPSFFSSAQWSAWPPPTSSRDNKSFSMMTGVTFSLFARVRVMKGETDRLWRRATENIRAVVLKADGGKRADQ